MPPGDSGLGVFVAPRPRYMEINKQTQGTHPTCCSSSPRVPGSLPSSFYLSETSCASLLYHVQGCQFKGKDLGGTGLLHLDRTGNL